MPEIFGAGDERFVVLHTILHIDGRQLVHGQVFDIISGKYDPLKIDHLLEVGAIAPVDPQRLAPLKVTARAEDGAFPLVDP